HRRLPAIDQSAGEDQSPRGDRPVSRPVHTQRGWRRAAQALVALGKAAGPIWAALRRAEAAGGAGARAAQRSATAVPRRAIGGAPSGGVAGESRMDVPQ